MGYVVRCRYESKHRTCTSARQRQYPLSTFRGGYLIATGERYGICPLAMDDGQAIPEGPICPRISGVSRGRVVCCCIGLPVGRTVVARGVSPVRLCNDNGIAGACAWTLVASLRDAIAHAVIAATRLLAAIAAACCGRVAIPC